MYMVHILFSESTTLSKREKTNWGRNRQTEFQKIKIVIKFFQIVIMITSCVSEHIKVIARIDENKSNDL